MITCHLYAFVGGFILDLILGDPYWLYHPIRLIGNLIGFFQSKWNKQGYSARKRRFLGGLMVILVTVITVAVVLGILAVAYSVNLIAGCVIEGIMTYQILATKCLKVESMKVYKELQKGDIEGARKAVSMIVGRDTENLDFKGVAKAAVETVAENSSDGVIAPMIFCAIGGPVLGFLYKSINTMDSMVGYKSEKYLDFGRIPAKLDDVVNYIPARFSALLIVLSSYLLGICPIYVDKTSKKKAFSGKNSLKIFLRDRFNHASPNSAQTEAACAGALGIQLAGNAVYFGKLYEKPHIGDEIRPVENEDIKRANLILYVSAFMCELICLIIICGAACLV